MPPGYRKKIHGILKQNMGTDAIHKRIPECFRNDVEFRLLS